MSIGPSSPIAGSAAGTFLAQIRGSDVDRAQQDSRTQTLRSESQEKAELAAGVGQADGEDHQTSDRDADGRRLWEFPRPQGGQEDGGETPHRSHAADPTGQSGGLLDLSG
jgi:hypothetical protein